MASIVGGAGNDTLFGTTSNDIIDALDGDDSILANNGADTVIAGAGNDTIDGGSSSDLMDGGLGDDRFIVDSAGDVVIEADGEGHDLILSSVTFTLGANVEDLTLTASSNISGTGNSLDNAITGNTGNNSLTGGAGNDTLVGGAGNDTYDVDSSGDVVTESASEGTDLVRASITYVLGSDVENLTLTGSSAIDGTGNALDNVVTGNTGDNSLTGGAGNDTLVGGAGNDTYDVDNSGDVVTEGGSAGTDLVRASATYTLASNIENLMLTGASAIDGTGNTLGNVLTGNSAANSLWGLSGNDTLDGSAGADTMAGGSGNDVFVVDDAGDTVVENSSEGTDTVQSSSTYSLGGNVENLTLTGASAIDGAGNTLNNLLTGNAAANSLTGVSGNDTLDGGAGADTLDGGAGNDTFVVDDAGDMVVEATSEGTDTVQSSITHTLGTNVERLTLTGANAVDGTGNALNNLLIGNAAANTLSDSAGNDTLDGGAGADTMAGGQGNDRYVVDDAGDVVTEAANQGTDIVLSSISLVLGVDVENLTLSGTGAIDGIGNVLNNTIVGNIAANVLQGGAGNDLLDGGLGADTLQGGVGNDTYVVESPDDVVAENAAEGTDSVTSLLTYALGSNLENLYLIGNVAIDGTGNDADNNISGNSAANSLIGGEGDDSLYGNGGGDTLAGGSGNDYYTIFTVDSAAVVFENAGEGTDTVAAYISYTLASGIENLYLYSDVPSDGTGNALDNLIEGNYLANSLAGGAGNDTLNGGADNDTLAGGAGDDQYSVDDAGDVVIENASEGTDLIVASISYTLGSNFENLSLVYGAVNGTGNSLANTISGDSGASSMAGLDGNDSLDGGDGWDADTLDGGSGSDTMRGGQGDDLYIVDSSSDVVIEVVFGGVDVVQSSASYTLGAEVDNLTLTGSSTLAGTGNSLNNVLTGNSGNNTLTGNGGYDTLDGGAGNDRLVGGTEDDLYIVNATGDVVVESAGEGFDTVESTVTYTLAANVENLTLTGGSAINGTGNTLDNTLIGNDASNTLSASSGSDNLIGAGGNDSLHGGADSDWLDGGAGNDTMNGGAGDDYYNVDSAGDVVADASAEGVDRVTSTVTYTLGTYTEVLFLAASGISGTGNASNNALYCFINGNAVSGLGGTDLLFGGQGNDTLDGGTGVDSMWGAGGDDYYIVDSVTDSVVENASSGSDTIQSSVTFSLSANVENLVLTGAGTVNGTGNELANALTGNSGNNTLAGGDGNDTLDGGAGNDTLQGGAGDDTYVVDVATDSISEGTNSGIDTVKSAVSWTLSSNFEHLFLTGSSSSSGTGNAYDNLVVGGGGANSLDGKAGADTMLGGAGDDTYQVDNAGDSVLENASEGIDFVISTISYALGAHVENLDLSGDAAIVGIGNDLDNVLVGSTAANSLEGGWGNDSLNGGSGADTLSGGAGNDTFSLDESGDVAHEGVDGGTDLVRSRVSHTLDIYIENLTLTGDAPSIDGTGNDLDNQITGSGGVNVIRGMAGNDTLTGSTTDDSDVDSLFGGAGDDLYYITATVDLIAEDVNEGFDSVIATVSYVLTENLENLVLSGTSALNGTGNGRDNQITGNDSANSMSGEAGADSLLGGGGNDSLEGGTEDDQLVGGDGSDSLVGGAGGDEISGGTGNDSLDGGAGADELTGGVGNDVYVVDDVGDVIVEVEGEGTDLVQSSVTHNLGEAFERLTLTGSASVDGTGNSLDNTMIGNAGANVLDGASGDDSMAGSSNDDTLRGGDGNDVLNGGTGNDSLAGGIGNDRYVLDSLDDVVLENAGEGMDLVESSVSWTLTDHFENLTLTGSVSTIGVGNELANLIIGNSGANTLSGGMGNDTLDGDSGADQLEGGDGDDTFIIGAAGDTVVEALNGGTDLVISSVSYTLASHVENLRIDTSILGSGRLGTGNDLANKLTGDSHADTLAGGEGNDTLTGMGGNDRLEGGAGDDLYVADSGDVIVENANAGLDLVESSSTFTLAVNVENLTLTGLSAINGTGNAVANVIAGNDAVNVLSGLAGDDDLYGHGGNDSLVGSTGFDWLDGGAGNDSMNGGTENDIYIVDSVGDVVVEASGQGVDTVYASVSFTLGTYVENLVLTTGGTHGIGTDGAFVNIMSCSDFGNSLDARAGDDVLFGGGGNDTLDGGTGSDEMQGMWGDDLYIVSVATDDVVEFESEGVDTVQSSVTYTLSANVENLVLTGAGGIHGTGNVLDNVLTGNTGANSLSGGAGSDTLVGGMGNDNLIGGGDSDQFTFGSTLGATNIDVIADFVSGTDTLALDDDVFGSLAGLGGAPFGLPGANFVANAGGVAGDSDDFVLYDISTGRLYYDADGNGAGARVQFATLTGAPTLVAGDIQVIA